MLYIIFSLLVLLTIICLVLLFKSSKKQDVKTYDNEFNDIEKELTVISTRLDEMNKSNVYLHQTVERKLFEIRADNEKRLEDIRATVEEKLQKTLENRLTSTFKTVSDQLESVYKQLGEMQNLTKGVDNLEKVLTNVKTRGMWGELQAERILQEILLPEQYLKNVVTKKGSKDPVEFAVRLPGSNEEQVLLPIDSKFPREDYERLCDSTQSGNQEEVRVLKTAIERRIKDEAKDIRDKYIDVPNTTDFAVMFLPIEGLYAEVLSIPGLQEKLQREFHVMLAGPTTLASLLNSLQMGFRTLAIEKKSAEVWHVLGQVKTEFSKFEFTLSKVQEKLNSASKEVENAFTRQRVMARKLKGVESIELESEFDEQTNLIEGPEED